MIHMSYLEWTFLGDCNLLHLRQATPYSQPWGQTGALFCMHPGLNTISALYHFWSYQPRDPCSGILFNFYPPSIANHLTYFKVKFRQTQNYCYWSKELAQRNEMHSMIFSKKSYISLTIFVINRYSKTVQQKYEARYKCRSSMSFKIF